MTTLNRRLLLVGSGTFAAGAMFHISRRAKAASVAKTLETKVISQKPRFYHGWPTLTRRKNGELLVVCSGGRESHVCPFGRVELIRSKDNGATWSFPRVLLDGPIDERDAGIVETAKGSLLVSTFTSLAYESLLPRAKNKTSWLAVHNRISKSERQAELGTWMLRSIDGGVTWSSRYACPVNSPHGPIQLADGRLLYAGKELWSGQNRIGVCFSQDDGQTWSSLTAIPTRNGDDHKKYHELHAVEAAGGRIVVHIRNHNSRNAGETLQCESLDGGETWTKPRSIGVWGLPSFLLRLKDDRLLMSYGYRRKPFGNQARVSHDHGRTWSTPLTISSDGAGGDLGYPTTVQLENESLLSVWYERMENSSKAVLRQSNWRLVS
jgi:sialidase-1